MLKLAFSRRELQIRRYKKSHNTFDAFPDKVAIQLNDTHPAIAIAELMRLLIDVEGLESDKAWDITTDVFGYTNHTVLPEALEKWSVKLIEYVLPRHLQIIYDINWRFLERVRPQCNGDEHKLSRLSIIEEGDEKRVRMANLAIVGSHSVNGVAALHTEILKESIFKDFYELWPEKFNNKTNGITQRRWLKLCNPLLASLIDSHIGSEWVTDLYQLKKLIPLSENSEFQQQWSAVKRQNKQSLAKHIKETTQIELNPDSIFDCHIKRIHQNLEQRGTNNTKLQITFSI